MNEFCILLSFNLSLSFAYLKRAVFCEWWLTPQPVSLVEYAQQLVVSMTTGGKSY